MYSHERDSARSVRQLLCPEGLCNDWLAARQACWQSPPPLHPCLTVTAWPPALPPAGLQKLLEQKDNHIFKGLSTLATFGCPFKDAVAGGSNAFSGRRPAVPRDAAWPLWLPGGWCKACLCAH